MGQPNILKIYYRKEQTLGTETSKYQEEEKINNDFQSSGERNGTSPNQCCFGNTGVVGPRDLLLIEVERFGKSDQRG